jgi:hypothetical protein
MHAATARPTVTARASSARATKNQRTVRCAAAPSAKRVETEQKVRPRRGRRARPRRDDAIGGRRARGRAEARATSMEGSKRARAMGRILIARTRALERAGAGRTRSGGAMKARREPSIGSRSARAGRGVDGGTRARATRTTARDRWVEETRARWIRRRAASGARASGAGGGGRGAAVDKERRGGATRGEGPRSRSRRGLGSMGTGRGMRRGARGVCERLTRARRRV